MGVHKANASAFIAANPELSAHRRFAGERTREDASSDKSGPRDGGLKPVSIDRVAEAAVGVDGSLTRGREYLRIMRFGAVEIGLSPRESTRLLKNADGDGNGHVEASELATYLSRFDHGKDGHLNSQEIKSAVHGIRTGGDKGRGWVRAHVQPDSPKAAAAAIVAPYDRTRPADREPGMSLREAPDVIKIRHGASGGLNPSTRIQFSEEGARRFWRDVDSNDDGRVTPGELAKVLASYDANGNGRLSYQELAKIEERYR